MKYWMKLFTRTLWSANTHWKLNSKSVITGKPSPHHTRPQIQDYRIHILHIVIRFNLNAAFAFLEIDAACTLRILDFGFRNITSSQISKFKLITPYYSWKNILLKKWQHPSILTTIIRLLAVRCVLSCQKITGKKCSSLFCFLGILIQWWFIRRSES